jgi:hypothetical protein
LYKGTNLLPRVTNIAAGGVNSFFTVDATRVAKQGEGELRGLGRITADTWACGQGIWGGLGNGRWTHVQGTPTKIKALSGLFEYDEIRNTVIPIRLSHLSVGSTHASAIMNNVTHLGASDRSSENDTNWGADVLVSQILGATFPLPYCFKNPGAFTPDLRSFLALHIPMS